MVVPRLHVAGRKQGNLGRPPCFDVGEQRDERHNHRTKVSAEICHGDLPRGRELWGRRLSDVSLVETPALTCVRLGCRARQSPPSSMAVPSRACPQRRRCEVGRRVRVADDSNTTHSNRITTQPPPTPQHGSPRQTTQPKE